MYNYTTFFFIDSSVSGLAVPEQEFHQEMNKINNWLAELRSLGVDTKSRNDLTDEKELQDATDNIKRSLYEEYKKAYAQT